MIDINKFEKLADEIISNVKKDEMKTPLQELIQYESDLTNMFDSDVRAAGAILEYIRTNKKDMLKTEKEMMCGFAYKCRDIMAADEFAITHWYDKTFNTKEK